jgi:hypothetical protein
MINQGASKQIAVIVESPQKRPALSELSDNEEIVIKKMNLGKMVYKVVRYDEELIPMSRKYGKI